MSWKASFSTKICLGKTIVAYTKPKNGKKCGESKRRVTRSRLLVLILEEGVLYDPGMDEGKMFYELHVLRMDRICGIEFLDCIVKLGNGVVSRASCVPDTPQRNIIYIPDFVRAIHVKVVCKGWKDLELNDDEEPIEEIW